MYHCKEQKRQMFGESLVFMSGTSREIVLKHPFRQPIAG